MAPGGRRSAATAWLLLPRPPAEKGARLPLRPMDLNSNPGLSLYITVMNTNTLASGWEHVSLRGAAIIISPPALSSVSAATGRRDWKDFSDRFSRLKLKTQNSQISCKVLPSSSRERRPFIISAPRTGCFTSCGSWLMFIAAVISHEQFMMLAFRIFLLLLVTSPQASFYLSAAQTSIRTRSVSNGVVISCRTFRDAYRDVCYYSKSIEALTCHSFKVTGLF